jgi:hypothetical protein
MSVGHNDLDKRIRDLGTCLEKPLFSCYGIRPSLRHHGFGVWRTLNPEKAFGWPTCPDPVGILAGLFHARSLRPGDMYRGISAPSRCLCGMNGGVFLWYFKRCGL